MKSKFSLEKYSRILILLLFIIVLTVIRPHSFPTVNNISNVLWSISVVGILVSGSIFVMLLGGIDLSVGSLMGLSAVVTVITIRNYDYSNTGVLIGIALALLVGIAAGALAWLPGYDLPCTGFSGDLCDPEYLPRNLHGSDEQ